MVLWVLVILMKGTHTENVLSKLLGFDAGEHSEQQIHDSRCPNVFDH